MAKSLRVTFEGLCEFVIRTGQAEVYLPSGGGIHGQFLIIRADFLNVPMTTWMPTHVGLTRDFDADELRVVPRQIAIWSLKGQDATFKRPSATGAPQWKNRELVIDFKTEHAGATVKDRVKIRADHPDAGIVTLIGDQTELDPEAPGPNDNFTLKKGTVAKPGAFSRLVHWKVKGNNDHGITNGNSQKIVLRDDVEAWAMISNVAPVSAEEGLKHFVHHYEGITLASTDKKMTIEQSFANVFDCVPPTAYP